MRKHIKSSNFKETEIHFQIEWVQSRSTNTETFDATVELKSLIKNYPSVIKNNRSQKSTGFSNEKFTGKGIKKISMTKFFFYAMKVIKKRRNKKKKNRKSTKYSNMKIKLLSKIKQKR